MKPFSIVMLPGDGVGPECTRAVELALHSLADAFGHEFRFDTHLIGGAAIDAAGDPYPAATRAACEAADAVFLGAVGGPKWDGKTPRPEQGLLALRQHLGLFANLRPVAVLPDLVDASPLKPEVVEGVDMLIVRELTGGLYFGQRTRTEDRATDECVYTVAEIERVAHVAFKAARDRRRKVTSVDKANVIETSRLWRETVSRIHRDHYPDVALEHALVDSMAMHLITRPRSFDVILTENMFGDILSDEASVLSGSIGMLGSASLGQGGPGVFEPIHGSAPDIAGQDLANPNGSLMSAAMLLRHGLGLTDEADVLEAAVKGVLSEGVRTRDLGGHARCSEVAEAVAARIRKLKVHAHPRGSMHWA